jgi:DNA-binding transcriptional LysR family regulator
MELRHLRYFVAVAEEENITRAATRLNVSQPPLSRQIRDLEDELRVELFTRTAKSLSLTRAGRIFVREARAVLQRADEAVRKVRAAAAGGDDEIHVGYAPSPTGEFLSSVLQAFKKRTPALNVVLHDMTLAEMLQGLRSKQLQAALVVQSMSSIPPGLRFDRLRSYRVGAILPKNHPLAKRRALRLEDLLNEPVAVLSKKDYADYHAWLRKALGTNARKLRIAEECDGAMSLIAAVESGRAIAVSAESIMSVAGTRLAFVRLTPAPEPMHVGIIYPTGSSPNSPTTQFADAAQSVAASMKGKPWNETRKS